MKFGEAIEMVKNGYNMRLPHWSEDVCLSMLVPSDGGNLSFPIIVKETCNSCTPYIFTNDDIFIDYWEVE